MAAATPSGEPALSVIIPTRGRPAVLEETLRRLISQGGNDPIEAIVVHAGDGDGSAEAIAALASEAPWPLRAFEEAGLGPARRRNRGVREARGPICLFLGDDTFPARNLVRHHLDFHARNLEETDAMLGLVTPAPPLDEHPFIRWLHEEGTQFGYGNLESGTVVPAGCFWTANISVKRSLLERWEGFDEDFGVAACEDSELGFRLARRGLQIHYRSEARVEHFHPTDLKSTLDRMSAVGKAYVRLRELAPEATRPSRPGLRHRLKAVALTLGMRGAPDRTRAHTWRFLCDEILREAYWRTRGEDPPRIGEALERLAMRDPEASPSRPPEPVTS